MSELIVDKETLAAVLGISLRHLARLVAQGLPRLEAGSSRGHRDRYDLVAVMAWMRAREATMRPASGASAREEYLRATTEKARIDIERAKLELAARRGELVPRAAVLEAGRAVVRVWTSRIRALPHRLVGLGLVPMGAEPKLEAVCRELLEDIAAWRPLAGASRSDNRDGDDEG